MRALTVEEKVLRRVRERFAKGVRNYGLVSDGDRILVGLSGGKDSLALLELLAERSRIWKPRFSVIAAHIWMSNVPYRADMDYLRNFAARLGVELMCREASFDAGADTRPDDVVFLFLAHKQPIKISLYDNEILGHWRTRIKQNERQCNRLQINNLCKSVPSVSSVVNRWQIIIYFEPILKSSVYTRMACPLSSKTT